MNTLNIIKTDIGCSHEMLHTMYDENGLFAGSAVYTVGFSFTSMRPQAPDFYAAEDDFVFEVEHGFLYVEEITTDESTIKGDYSFDPIDNNSLLCIKQACADATLRHHAAGCFTF